MFVFGELHGRGHSLYAQVIGGSLLMMAGVAAIAFASATTSEQSRWKQAAHRESQRYHIAPDYVEARMDGRQAASEAKPARTALDYLLVAAATSIFVFFGFTARVPQLPLNWPPAPLPSAPPLAPLLLRPSTPHPT